MNLRKIKITSLLLFTLFSVISISFPAYAAKDDISDPSNYYKWTQTNTDQPWVKAWGGSNNQGCFAVSIAVQGARAGFVKTGNGKGWNPLNLASGSDGSAPDRATGIDKNDKSYMFKPRKNVGNYSMGKLHASGNYQENAKGMGAANARKGIKAIYDAGYYPIVHLSGGAGYPAKTHWMAVNKVSGNKISYYDPGRTKNSDTAKALKIQHKTVLGCTAWVNGYGNGPWKIQDAPSEDASDFNSKDDGSNKGNSKKSSSDTSGNSGSGMTAAKIKPIFNPFTTPTASNNSIGYDTEEKNSAIDRSTRMTFYDYLGPLLVSWLQVAAIAFMFMFLGWTIVTTLIALADYQTGGTISKISADNHGGKLNKFIFPYGNIKSVQLIKKTFLIMFLIVLICGLVLTDTLPLILGQFFSWLVALV